MFNRPKAVNNQRTIKRLALRYGKFLVSRNDATAQRRWHCSLRRCVVARDSLRYAFVSFGAFVGFCVSKKFYLCQSKDGLFMHGILCYLSQVGDLTDGAYRAKGAHERVRLGGDGEGRCGTSGDTKKWWLSCAND